MNRKQIQRGQVTLLAVAVLLVLTLAALLLFDFHNAMRAKLKVESAEQAAALAGAQWQVIGLNMLGDINLLKACTLMTGAEEALPSVPLTADRLRELKKKSGINGPVSNDQIERWQKEQRLKSRLRTLSETQSRISFIVPLLGVMAVQQTAKQNGMSGSSNILKSYFSETLPLNDYRDQAIEGFLWYVPYRKLVGEIVDQRCAVRCNARIQEMPDQWSNQEGSYDYRTGSNVNFRLLLSDRSLYAAISTQDFCQWQLKKMVKNAYCLREPWWYLTYQPGAFIKESELLPLGIQFLGGTDMSELLPFLTNQQMPANIMQDDDYPEKYWCCYDSKWYPNDESGKWRDRSAYDEEAYTALQYGWKRGIWLRNNRRKGFLYEGAVCAVDGAVQLARTASFRPNLQKNSEEESPIRVKELVKSRSSRTVTVGMTSTGDAASFGVAAKVVGGFHDLRDDDDEPIATPVVLPVFSRGLLVPLSLPMDVQMITSGEDNLKKFLIWLSTKPNIDTVAPPSGTEGYLFLLKKLMDPDFLRSGFNPDFPGLNSAAPEMLFSGDYKYDKDTNPRGAGWLQQAYIARAAVSPIRLVDSGKKDKDGNSVMVSESAVPDNVVTTLPQTYTGPDGTTQNFYEDFSDAVRVYYGTKASGYHYYIVRSGVIQTNEDVGCDGKLFQPAGPGNFVNGTDTGPVGKGGSGSSGSGNNNYNFHGRR